MSNLRPLSIRDFENPKNHKGVPNNALEMLVPGMVAARGVKADSNAGLCDARKTGRKTNAEKDKPFGTYKPDDLIPANREQWLLVGTPRTSNPKEQLKYFALMGQDPKTGFSHFYQVDAKLVFFFPDYRCNTPKVADNQEQWGEIVRAVSLYQERMSDQELCDMQLQGELVADARRNQKKR